MHLHETAALYYSLVLVLIRHAIWWRSGFVAEMIAALVSRDRDEFSIAEYTSPREPAAGLRRPAPGVARQERRP